MGQASAAKKAGLVEESKRLEAVYFRSANPALRRWWFDLRQAAAKYGFGRCETLPIRSNAEGVARYVGGYVGKEWAMREPRDKGLRTVRYSLARRPWGYRWAFAAGESKTWRMGCAVLGGLLCCDDFSGALGKRWAWNWRSEISAFGRHWETCLRVVSEMSDNLTFDDRLARASRLAEAIWRHEQTQEQKA